MDTVAYMEITSSRVHVSASLAEEAVVALPVERFDVQRGLLRPAPVSRETNRKSSSLREVSILDCDRDVAGGLASERGFSASPSPVSMPLARESQHRGVAQDVEVGRVVRLRREDRESLAMTALYAARALAVLEGLDALSPPATRSSVPPRGALLDEERALLAEAHATARLCCGSETEVMGRVDAIPGVTDDDARVRGLGSSRSGSVRARSGPVGEARDVGGGSRRSRDDGVDRAEVGGLGQPTLHPLPRAAYRGG
jgi:hypothetical protein